MSLTLSYHFPLNTHVEVRIVIISGDGEELSDMGQGVLKVSYTLILAVVTWLYTRTYEKIIELNEKKMHFTLSN